MAEKNPKERLAQQAQKLGMGKDLEMPPSGEKDA